MRTTAFQKKILVNVLGICLLYIERYFQEHQFSVFFFMAQISQILLLRRSKITVWERHLFKKNLINESLGLCLPYVKRYFQEHQWSTFLFMAQITQILLFSEMPIWERSKITVWEWQLFKNKICYGSFRYVSTLCKKGIFKSTSEALFSLWLK